MSYTYETMSTEELTLLLKNYMDPKYWELNDFTKVINNAHVEDGVVWFDFNQFSLGLDPDRLGFVDVMNINGFEVEE